MAPPGRSSSPMIWANANTPIRLKKTLSQRLDPAPIQVVLPPPHPAALRAPAAAVGEGVAAAARRQDERLALRAVGERRFPARHVAQARRERLALTQGI